MGDMGAPIAWRILDAGFPTTLWARRPETLAPFEESTATIASSLIELGGASDVIGVCVLADDDVRSVVLGDTGILAGMSPGGVIALHSTIRPDTCRELAEAAEAKGVRVLDAPVSGGSAKARAGELVVLVGGDRDVYDEVVNVFSSFGSNVVHLGPLGSGQLAKAINNTLMTANIGLAEEAARLGVSFGLDGEALLQALSHGSSASFALEVLKSVPGGLKNFPAGNLLRKDVDIFEHLMTEYGLEAGPVEAAAEWALDVMGSPKKETN
jgi:3-hydroxyisobutyrate dehydrogenase-like beta-hydroxyacid dehydrogenase